MVKDTIPRIKTCGAFVSLKNGYKGPGSAGIVIEVT